MFSFLRRRSAVRATPARRPNCRPRLEVLEDRCVPAQVWAVHSSVDDGTMRGTLRYAVDHAGSGDTIRIDRDVQSIQLTGGELVLDKDQTIEPAGPGLKRRGTIATEAAVHLPGWAESPFAEETRPTISGNNSSRVFEVAAGAHVTLDNLI